MKFPSPILLCFAAAFSSLSCVEAPASPEATSNSAAGSTIETFRIQARIFCTTAQPFCGHPTRESLINSYFLAINEMNLQYIPTGYSFRAMTPIITVDDRLASLSGPEGDAANGETNAAIYNTMIQMASLQPDRITLFLTPNNRKCWNGLPCPGTDDGFTDDDVIFCKIPQVDGEAAQGSTYAHEMGHYWCLQHSFSKRDPLGDYDGDAHGCDTMPNVHDTPPDPGAKESADTQDFHEWCETLEVDADPVSPHPTYCLVSCYMSINGQTIETNLHPMVGNAMSYWHFECRAPYVVDYQRYEAFSPGQIDQIHQCRALVPMRIPLNNVCADDSDHDGVCDSLDLCLGVLDARNDDTDGDGFASPCDKCPDDPSGAANNFDGDRYCDESDVCPADQDTSMDDSDMDGIWDTCDTCPNSRDGSNLDTDGDGRGDVCDTDDDDDGCSDRVDQHPLSNSVPIGTQLNVNCSDQTSTAYGSESGDTDNDGFLDCRDTDDDDDGIRDELDPCPRTGSDTCLYNGRSCPLTPIGFTCRGGACNQEYLRVMERVNPDPTRSFIYEIESLRGDTLRLKPLQGKSIVDSIGGIRGTLPFNNTGSRLQGALRMDIVDARDRVVIALRSSYNGSSVTSSGTSGARIEVTFPAGNAPISVRGVQ